MSKKVHHYNKDTRIYIHSTPALESPLEPGVYLIPANATDIPIPKNIPEGKLAQLREDDSGWDIINDNSGVWYNSVGKEVNITSPIGDVSGLTRTPQPTPAHDLVDGEWILNTEKKLQLEVQERQKLAKNIDVAVATIYGQFTPFQAEYELREKQAYEYIQSGYHGEPPEQVAAFAVPAEMTVQDATNLIMQQAQNLRSAMNQLGVLRMRKYEVLKAPTIEEARTVATSILTAIQLVAASLT